MLPQQQGRLRDAQAPSGSCCWRDWVCTKLMN